MGFCGAEFCCDAEISLEMLQRSIYIHFMRNGMDPLHQESMK
jgi:hypothetical protein